MHKRKLYGLIGLVLAGLVLLWGVGQVLAKGENPQTPERSKKITQADRQAAAERADAAGFELETPGTAAMPMPGTAPHYFSHPNYANSPLPGNIVAEWNAIAQDILQPAPMPGMPMPMGGTSMSAAFVHLSYMQAAVYNALVAIEGGYAPYNSTLTADPAASRDAAVATAAYGVLNHYFPSATLTGKYAASLAAIPDSTAKTDGIAVGQAAADEIIALRSGDVLTGNGGYTVPAPGPGVWESTMMPPEPPVDPWMAVLTPFLRTLPDQYRPVPPPALDSLEYATDLNEVKDIGSAMSMTRTPAQTEVARFWTTNMVIQTNAAYRQQAASRGLGLLDTARLMVMGNMAATDSLIATFDAKYFYNLWRPVTAIQRADTDGNALTDPDPTWMPLVMTPNFPEYVAGHGSFVSAQAEVYTQIFGTPNIAIDLDSSVTGTTRHFATADDLRIEIVNARTWAGLHLRNSSVLAVGIGQQLVTDAMLNYFAPAPDLSAHVMTSGGIRKFVDTLPGLGAANPNNLGQYIPVAVPDQATYLGSDYYEIAVVQYSEKMHSDLPPTLLRGYVQLSTAEVPGLNAPLANTLLDGTADPIIGHTGVTPPHYLGPTIVATKDRPVRIKFYNLLPKDVDGNLFLPVDTTVMGAGMGPLMANMMEPDPQNPMSGMIPKPYGSYAENRATLHLHGGISPWISDGTPHQWITPAGDGTAYPQGVSVVPVPDMGDSGDPNDGVMTFYYTNQQSARLMFYHDHAYGITRLNVYAGEAAPYLITDDTEKKLLPASVDNPTGLGLIPGPVDTIPLVVQDKTFVPSETQLAVSDETWDMTRWGGVGNLWLPHVYSPAQNPGDSSGVNQFGRWAYGPWFWPPTSNLKYGPINNAYYDINCNPDTGWCEPPLMPGVPFNSMGMEAFMDTPLVNGTPYPTVTVDPKAYRFRVLNAANDRFFNLSLYKADPLALTEVQLNPAEVLAALGDPTVFPTPVAGTEGPSWIQIGTEGGFLPAPVVIPAQPTTWVTDPTVFNAGNVDKHSLLLGPAERADVIVDFSAYAGQTLILYNDAPAAFPARDPRYDYYTGNGDYRATGGAPSTLPGYGPNTRTVMQIKVAAAAPAPAYDLVALQTAFKAKSLGGQGVFETSQHPIVVGQGAYNSAYGTTFQSNGPLAGLAQIFDNSLTFKTLLGATLTMPLQPKMIQDEMGEAFDPIYGRMSGFLGLETPNAQAGNQNMILYGFGLPPTEVLRGIELPAGVELAPISTTDDGSQIWKITHNGVDTHPVHFHLYDVQLINRVGWDGIIRKPDLNELGWKDTVRVSPLEDTIVALRPLVPSVPWDLPNSNRLIDPTMPENASLTDTAMVIFDPSGNPVTITNHYVNFGWEYVWHCHILSHEEMDMMRPQSIGVKPKTPANLTATQGGVGVSQVVNLEWADNSLGETSFTVQRAEFAIGPWTDLATLPINTTTYADAVGNVNQEYFYRVFASNTVGDTATYAAPSIGFPNTTMVSEFSNTASITVTMAPPAAPTTLTAAVQAGPQVALGWMDNAVDETGFVLERSVNAGPFAQIAAPGPQINTGNMTYTDAAVTAGNTYAYRVKAVNGALSSAWSNTATVSVTVPVPAAPTNLTATLQAGPQVALGWMDNAVDETGFVLERSVNAGPFAQIAAPGPQINTGNMTYTDAAVTAGNTYTYRVKAVNGVLSSAWSNTATVVVTVSPIPALPSGVLATAARQGQFTDRITLTWTDNANNETGYTIQRATNAAFTTGRVTTTVGANSTSFAAGSNFRRNRNFYFRIRAFNNAGVSAWVNATPFPVRTP